MFDPELFWLNDGPVGVESGTIEVRVETADGKSWRLLEWEAGFIAGNANLAGPQVRWILPNLGRERFELVLATPGNPEAASRYTLLFRARAIRVSVGTATMNL